MRAAAAGYAERRNPAVALATLGALALAALATFAPFSLLLAHVPAPPYSALLIYALARARPEATPAWLAFVVGAGCDLLAGTGVGVWAAVHVVALACARTGPCARASGLGWLAFACVCAPALATAEWLARALAARELLAPWGFAARAAAAAAAYPLVFLLARGLQGSRA